MSKKRAISGLIAGMMMLCVAMLPQITYAQENVIEVQNKTGVIFVNDSTKYDMEDYWDATIEKSKAPIREGFVFGGWYERGNDGKLQALKQSDLIANGIPKEKENVYAKFVPAQVLAVKTQIPSDTASGTGTTHIRIITSIDSKEYGCVGFDVWFNNNGHKSGETRDAYKSLVYTDKDNEEQTLTPKEMFHEDSGYLVRLKINNIANDNFTKLINVRPYWKTLDGTKVEGMAKYVHIEDGYSGYYSVPVNLQSGNEVAAGIVTMKYDKDTLELIKTGNAVELGRVFKELDYNVDEEKGIITFAANSESMSAEIKDVAQGIFANVRFRVKNGKKASERYDFDVDAAENTFANWDEEFVNVYAVDYKH